MPKKNAVKLVESLGYTIKFDASKTEEKYRKPNSPMNSFNLPQEYYVVRRKNGYWKAEHVFEPMW